MEADPRGRMLAVGNSNGYVILFETDSQAEWKPAHSMAPKDEVPVTSIGLLQRSGLSSIFIAGFANGSVKLIHAENGTLLADLSCHSRSLNALACHPTKPIFATCSDDTFLHVFSVSSEREDLIDTTLVLSSRVNDYQLVGLAFGGEGSNSLVSAPYDFKTLAVWSNIIS